MLREVQNQEMHAFLRRVIEIEEEFSYQKKGRDSERKAKIKSELEKTFKN